jgi:hypothetical protein
MLLFFLLACARNNDIDNAALPCGDRAYKMTSMSWATCRPDQTGRLEWEPPTQGARTENEDRVGAILLCVCE